MNACSPVSLLGVTNAPKQDSALCIDLGKKEKPKSKQEPGRTKKAVCVLSLAQALHGYWAKY